MPRGLGGRGCGGGAGSGGPSNGSACGRGARLRRRARPPRALGVGPPEAPRHAGRAQQGTRDPRHRAHPRAGRGVARRAARGADPRRGARRARRRRPAREPARRRDDRRLDRRVLPRQQRRPVPDERGRVRAVAVHLELDPGGAADRAAEQRLRAGPPGQPLRVRRARPAAVGRWPRLQPRLPVHGEGAVLAGVRHRAHEGPELELRGRRRGVPGRRAARRMDPRESRRSLVGALRAVPHAVLARLPRARAVPDGRVPLGGRLPLRARLHPGPRARVRGRRGARAHVGEQRGAGPAAGRRGHQQPGPGRRLRGLRDGLVRRRERAVLGADLVVQLHGTRRLEALGPMGPVQELHEPRDGGVRHAPRRRVPRAAVLRVPAEQLERPPSTRRTSGSRPPPTRS